MIKNYLVVAFRNLRKHHFYSLINILGLTLGLTSVILISLYVIDELSYDLHQKDAARIYRMDFDGNINGNRFNTALASAPVAETMVEDYPEVVDATRLRGTGNWLVRKEGEMTSYKENKVIFADQNFFDFFNIPLRKGTAETALAQPNTVALSQSLATKIFGDEDPIGQSIVLDNDINAEVKAVYEDMPSNMHFHFDMLISMEGREEANSQMWMSFNFNTYLKLTEGANARDLEAKFPELIQKYMGPEVEQYMGQSLKEFMENGNQAAFYLFPMQDIHLYSDKLGELEQNGDIRYVVIFSAIAIFILILACINFMNLATARSAGRAKEVGIRKTMGAYRQQLIYQFLTEAVLISFLSILLSIAVTMIVLPYFNELADKSIDWQNLFTSKFMAVYFGILILVSLLAGSYPAFYLSAFRPVEVLKGKLASGFKGRGLRSALVVLQFTVSIVMMLGTYFVFHQLSYIQNKKLGYEKEHVLMVQDAWLLGEKAATLKQELRNHTQIKHATLSGYSPVGGSNNNNLWFKGTSSSQSDSHVITQYFVDYDYLDVYGIRVLSGRAFSKDFASDSSAILINEEAARQFGLEDPLGKTLSTYREFGDNPILKPFKVIGVVKDFHFSNMREKIAPLIMLLGESRGYLSLKVSPDNVDQTLSHVENKWSEFGPGQPFEYTFMDQRFDNLYENEARIGKVFSVFAFLAIFIACLGLYGLAAFTTEQKRKEIGIRKVLGASTFQILTLLSKEFLQLVLIAFLIGSLIGYWGMNEWLSDFAYRISINNPLAFILTGAGAFLIAWLTMSAQSFRAATSNPANSLKEE